MSITGYAENKNGDSVSYEKVTDENVTNFLNGHIMFFEKYDESTHTYSDFLSDETFTRTFKDCKVDVSQESERILGVAEHSWSDTDEKHR